jgi:hypothetical protein
MGSSAYSDWVVMGASSSPRLREPRTPFWPWHPGGVNTRTPLALERAYPYRGGGTRVHRFHCLRWRGDAGDQSRLASTRRIVRMNNGVPASSLTGEALPSSHFTVIRRQFLRQGNKLSRRDRLFQKHEFMPLLACPSRRPKSQDVVLACEQRPGRATDL